MRKEDYDLMHLLEAEFWWFAGMRRLMMAVLRRHLASPPGRILDVGCGTGINLFWLARELGPRRVTGCDFSAVALGWCAETIRSCCRPHSGDALPRLSRGDVRMLPFGEGTFDLATSFDVLDVFKNGDDVHALAEIHRVLRPGGAALIRVPAYQWLLSTHDTLFETRHRFSVPELSAKMSAVGFEILASTYANSILFPLALAQRLLRKYAGLAANETDAQPWPPGLGWLNGLFESCLRLEAWWLGRGGRLPFGLSAVCIGRKPAGVPAPR